MPDNLSNTPSSLSNTPDNLSNTPSSPLGSDLSKTLNSPLGNDLNNTLRGTIDALSVLDVNRLEKLCTDAESLVAGHRPETEQGAFEARALQRTLLELLRGTEENLRMLRELRTLRVLTPRSGDNTALSGGDRWVR